jgi:hypothetical protein
MSGIYVEDPTMQIVDVRLKKKKPDEFPPEPGTSYCGRYGHGLIVDAPNHVRPYGTNQLPPMVGTFYTDKPNVGPEGERYGNIVGIMLDPVETLTAAFDGAMNVLGMTLRDSDIEFTNNQLGQIPDINSNRGGIHWRVPMAEGENSAGVPVVIKSYTIHMEWQNTTPSLPCQLGLGMSHFLGRTINKPKEPFLVLGDYLTGIATYTYDFKWLEWYNGIIVTPDNQFEPATGGPAFLWLMDRHFNGTSWGAWSAVGSLGFPLFGPGDYYVWEIVAECQPMPNFQP